MNFCSDQIKKLWIRFWHSKFSCANAWLLLNNKPWQSWKRKFWFDIKINHKQN